ncbi:hypothetical protein C2G38_2207648 [Gigaspora rosea]|uniref:Protein kinase domain-containing protein n=1 Tax=Gigaspora rosea TaxID=44941 RepID=A0A397UKW4_9GLOM|nr:hypothetical protein C2G38_2207648 [Gigaspora rosea]
MITDFGLSKPLESTTKSIEGGMCAFTNPQGFKESENPFKREKPSDIYSIGVLFWELSTLNVIADEREAPINGTQLIL